MRADHRGFILRAVNDRTAADPTACAYTVWYRSLSSSESASRACFLRMYGGSGICPIRSTTPWKSSTAANRSVRSPNSPASTTSALSTGVAAGLSPR